jgi:hypothetical protein
MTEADDLDLVRGSGNLSRDLGIRTLSWSICGRTWRRGSSVPLTRSSLPPTRRAQ